MEATAKGSKGEEVETFFGFVENANVVPVYYFEEDWVAGLIGTGFATREEIKARSQGFWCFWKLNHPKAVYTTNLDVRAKEARPVCMVVVDTADAPRRCYSEHCSLVKDANGEDALIARRDFEVGDVVTVVSVEDMMDAMVGREHAVLVDVAVGKVTRSTSKTNAQVCFGGVIRCTKKIRNGEDIIVNPDLSKDKALNLMDCALVGDRDAHGKVLQVLGDEATVEWKAKGVVLEGELNRLPMRRVKGSIQYRKFL